MVPVLHTIAVFLLLAHTASHRMSGPMDAKNIGTFGIFGVRGTASAKMTKKMDSNTLRLFLSGDVMTGRAIDQILPYPGDPQLHERYVTRATTYVELAENANGPIPRKAGFDYIWGHGLGVLDEMTPDARLINLETAITARDSYWKGKAVNYRMNPANTPVFTAADIDFCALSNNHTMDYGLAGLKETLESLDKAKISHAGAGANSAEAAEPAVLEIPGKGRVIVFSIGSTNSGIPEIWGAMTDRPGLNVIRDYDLNRARAVMSWTRRNKKDGDIVVLSIHWDGNWGYDIPEEQYAMAHTIIDDWGVDLIIGHSSHHPKGLEIYNNKLIIYGAGDLINDYEGISGHEIYRPELCLMYFPELDMASGDLVRFRMAPFRMMNFQLVKASLEEAEWLAATIDSQSKQMDTRISLEENGYLVAEWPAMRDNKSNLGNREEEEDRQSN